MGFGETQVTWRRGDIMGRYHSFYVRVEGSAHSRHRNPEGVYKVDVLDEIQSMETAASIALSNAISNIPFLHEHAGSQYSLKLYGSCGEEIIVSGSLDHDDEKACFCGRAIDPPHISIM